jgi:ABC-type sugar transport system ATPase subunit
MLMHRPRLLLLDEPHASLDARGGDLLDRELGAARDDGRAAVIVTHEVERVARVSDRLVVLRAGRVVLDERTDGLEPMAVRRMYEQAIQ